MTGASSRNSRLRAQTAPRLRLAPTSLARQRRYQRDSSVHTGTAPLSTLISRGWPLATHRPPRHRAAPLVTSPGDEARAVTRITAGGRGLSLAPPGGCRPADPV